MSVQLRSNPQRRLVFQRARVRAYTATSPSPLQYHKQLRLMGAREKVLVEGLDATRAAREVGYASTSQYPEWFKPRGKDRRK
jgi:AraC-like DNA-binding protein